MEKHKVQRLDVETKIRICDLIFQEFMAFVQNNKFLLNDPLVATSSIWVNDLQKHATTLDAESLALYYKKMIEPLKKLEGQISDTWDFQGMMNGSGMEAHVEANIFFALPESLPDTLDQFIAINKKGNTVNHQPATEPEVSPRQKRRQEIIEFIKIQKIIQQAATEISESGQFCFRVLGARGGGEPN